MKLFELPSQGRGGPEFQHRSVSKPEPYEPALFSEASRTWQPLYAMHVVRGQRRLRYWGDGRKLQRRACDEMRRWLPEDLGQLQKHM